jgi:hypothetical protein
MYISDETDADSRKISPSLCYVTVRGAEKMERARGANA